MKMKVIVAFGCMFTCVALNAVEYTYNNLARTDCPAGKYCCPSGTLVNGKPFCYACVDNALDCPTINPLFVGDKAE